MSAPAGLWTIWDLKMEGNAGWARAICAETAASEIAIRVLPVILEQWPMRKFPSKQVSFFWFSKQVAAKNMAKFKLLTRTAYAIA